MRVCPVSFTRDMALEFHEGNKTQHRFLIAIPDGCYLGLGADGVYAYSKSSHINQGRENPPIEPGDLLHILVRGDQVADSHLPSEWLDSKAEVLSITPQRLHDITERDAEEEGMPFFSGTLSSLDFYQGYWQRNYGNWDENPWVWKVEFKKEDRDED